MPMAFTVRSIIRTASELPLTEGCPTKLLASIATLFNWGGKSFRSHAYIGIFKASYLAIYSTWSNKLRL